MKLSPLPFFDENAVLILDQNTFKRLKVKKKQSSIKNLPCFCQNFSSVPSFFRPSTTQYFSNKKGWIFSKGYGKGSVFPQSCFLPQSKKSYLGVKSEKIPLDRRFLSEKKNLGIEKLKVFTKNFYSKMQWDLRPKSHPLLPRRGSNPLFRPWTLKLLL